MSRGLNLVIFIIVAIGICNHIFFARSAKPLSDEELVEQIQGSDRSELNQVFSVIAASDQKREMSFSNHGIASKTPTKYEDENIASEELRALEGETGLEFCTESEGTDAKESCGGIIFGDSRILLSNKVKYFRNEIYGADCDKWPDSKECQIYLLKCLKYLSRLSPTASEIRNYIEIIVRAVPANERLEKQLEKEYVGVLERTQ